MARYLLVIASLLVFGDGSAFAAEEIHRGTLCGIVAAAADHEPGGDLSWVRLPVSDASRLTASDRGHLKALLGPGAASSAAERRAIANAVAWFDWRIGPAAGTTHRTARVGVGESAGEMDCIDTSSNNTSLFLTLKLLRLLHHHRVEPPVSRGYLIDARLPHTTAVLAEAKSGAKWAIDNWTHNYGEMPDVEPLAAWQSER